MFISFIIIIISNYLLDIELNIVQLQISISICCLIWDIQVEKLKSYDNKNVKQIKVNVSYHILW